MSWGDSGASTNHAGRHGVNDSSGSWPEPGVFSKRRCLGLALLAGMIAGLVSWAGGEAIYGRFIPPLIATGGFPSIEEIEAAEQARRDGANKEASLTAAMLGASLGLTLGLAGGFVAGNARKSMKAAMAGLNVGGLGSGAAAWLLTPVFLKNYNPDTDVMLLAIAIYGSISMVSGAIAGLAFGMGLRSDPTNSPSGLLGSTLQGGLMGAALAVVVFQVAGMIAFPLSQTTLPVSISKASRLTSHLLVALLCAFGSAQFAIARFRKRQE